MPNKNYDDDWDCQSISKILRGQPLRLAVFLAAIE